MQLLVVPWRRGLPVALVVAVSVVLTYAGRSGAWIGVWSETQNYIGVSFIFAIPAAAGAGAWIASGNRRSGLDEQGRGASRPRVQVVTRQFLEPMVWVIAGYVLGSAPALVATALTADVGRPHALPIIAQAACLCGVTAVGEVLGSRLPWYFGAPVTAAVAYVGLGFLSFTADGILLSLTPIDERWMTFHQVVWWVLLLQTIFWLLVWLSAILRRADHPRSAFAAVLAAGLAATPLLYVTPSTRVVPNQSVAMSCASASDVEVCLPSAKSGLRDELSVEGRRAYSALDGLFVNEIALIDDEARGVSNSADQEIELAYQQVIDDKREPIFLSQAGDVSATTKLDVNQFHYRFIYFAIPPSRAAIPRTRGKRQASPTDVIHRWYLRSVDVPTDGSGGVGSPYLDDEFLDYEPHSAQVDAFEGLSEDGRARWFTRHAAALRSGSTTWDDLADL